MNDWLPNARVCAPRAGDPRPRYGARRRRLSHDESFLGIALFSGNSSMVPLPASVYLAHGLI